MEEKHAEQGVGEHLGKETCRHHNTTTSAPRVFTSRTHCASRKQAHGQNKQKTSHTLNLREQQHNQRSISGNTYWCRNINGNSTYIEIHQRRGDQIGKYFSLRNHPEAQAQPNLARKRKSRPHVATHRLAPSSTHDHKTTSRAATQPTQPTQRPMQPGKNSRNAVRKEQRQRSPRQEQQRKPSKNDRNTRHGGMNLKDKDCVDLGLS
jgi:hypothetical protein